MGKVTSDLHPSRPTVSDASSVWPPVSFWTFLWDIQAESMMPEVLIIALCMFKDCTLLKATVFKQMVWHSAPVGSPVAARFNRKHPEAHSAIKKVAAQYFSLEVHPAFFQRTSLLVVKFWTTSGSEVETHLSLWQRHRGQMTEMQLQPDLQFGEQLRGRGLLFQHQTTLLQLYMTMTVIKETY